jgi:hypothetical protein
VSSNLQLRQQILSSFYQSSNHVIEDEQISIEKERQKRKFHACAVKLIDYRCADKKKLLVS